MQAKLKFEKGGDLKRMVKNIKKHTMQKRGLAGIRTQVARFKVWSDHHYTTRPTETVSLKKIKIFIAQLWA